MDDNSTIFSGDTELDFFYKSALDIVDEIIEEYTDEELKAANEAIIKYSVPPFDRPHYLEVGTFDDPPLKHPEETEGLRLAISAKKTLEEVSRCLLDEEEISAEDLVTMTLIASYKMVMAVDINNLAKSTEKIKSNNRAASRVGSLMMKYAQIAQKGVEIYQGSQKGLDARHEGPRALYAEATDIAKDMWLNGCEMKHHKMQTWLQSEFVDKENKLPFLNLSDKSLRSKLKKVLYEIGRKDLIFGLQK